MSATDEVLVGATALHFLLYSNAMPARQPASQPASQHASGQQPIKSPKVYYISAFYFKICDNENELTRHLTHSDRLLGCIESIWVSFSELAKSYNLEVRPH